MAPPAKRRKVEQAVEEIAFDLAARQDFLTGFHKRKVQRAKRAQEKAEERARQDKIEERRKLREERKAQLALHVSQVNDMLRPAGLEMESSSDDENDIGTEGWEGIEEPEPEPIDHEAEYIDEDKYTTVTVEAMDVTKDGLFKASHDDPEEDNPDRPRMTDTAEESSHKSGRSLPVTRPWSKKRPLDKPKRPKKKRNFRYEAKLERKVNRLKERQKNRKQAEARKAS